MCSICPKIGLQLIGLPRDIKRKREWEVICGNPNIKKICIDHFNQNDLYLRDGKYETRSINVKPELNLNK